MKGMKSCFNCNVICPSLIYLTDPARAFTGDSDLRVYMFFREDDHRARIMCKGPRGSRPSPYFCMPLNMLEAFRNGSCLELRRRRRRGAGELWANLKFSTIERMSRALLLRKLC